MGKKPRKVPYHFDVKKLGGPLHPVIVTVRDNKDHIRVLLNSYYSTITGWGLLLTNTNPKFGD